MSTVKTRNKGALRGKSLNQLINESNMLDSAEKWLYSKISRNMFIRFASNGNKLSSKANGKRINFFISDEGVKKDVIEGILKCENKIKEVTYIKSLSKSLGEHSFTVDYKGKKRILTEFDIYDYDWFIDAISELYNNIDIEKILEKKERRIATFSDSKDGKTYIRYNIIERITNQDLTFEKNFLKPRSEIKATLTK